MIAPTQDEWDAWADHPITRWVLEGVARYALLQRDQWAQASWGSGVADQVQLNELRTRADAYEGLALLTYENALGLHEEQQDG